MLRKQRLDKKGIDMKDNKVEEEVAKMAKVENHENSDEAISSTEKDEINQTAIPGTSKSGENENPSRETGSKSMSNNRKQSS